MKTLIIEDELQAALRLESMIEKVDSKIKVLEVCESVQESIQWLKDNDHPDIIFMDIQLTDGSSFEILQKAEPQCPVVFVTAFDQFAIDAFKFNSIDYILKPYAQKDIELAIEKFKKQEFKVSKKQREKLSQVLKQVIEPKYKTRFFAKLNTSVLSISIEEILYFYYEDKATLLIKNDLRKVVVNYGIEALKECLNPTIFFKINRQCILNIDGISKMNVSKKGRIQIILKDQRQEFVSRAKTAEFKEWLDI